MGFVLSGILLLAVEISPMEILSGAVREFFRIETLETKVERTQKDGLGRVTHASYAIRFAKPKQFALVSVDPPGFVEGYADGRLVAWNDNEKRGFSGSADDLAPDLRERLQLLPGFGLNPLIPLNPNGYALKAEPRGAGVTVSFTPHDPRHDAIEMDFLREPYRVAAVRITGKTARKVVSYEGWKQSGGAWVFTSVRTVRIENRLRTEETLTFSDTRVNTPFPEGWLPAALPVSYAAAGANFFADE